MSSHKKGNSIHELKSLYSSTIKQQQMKVLHEVPLPIWYTTLSKSYVSQGIIGNLAIQSCII